ncbi:MAG: hypothetical protein ABEI86_12080, partial [Halobacteriaceae archaeon]
LLKANGVDPNEQLIADALDRIHKEAKVESSPLTRDDVDALLEELY